MRSSSCALVVAVLVTVLACYAQADMKEKIMPRYIKFMLECMKEDSSLDIGVCKEMGKEGNDNTQDKYKPCKCVIACVAKKSKTMTESGDADLHAFTTAVNEFENKEWSDEWARVSPLCEPVIKEQKNCDLAYDFFVCGYQKSEIFRGILKRFQDAVDKN